MVENKMYELQILNGFRGLMLTAQAPGAKVKPFRLTIDNNSSRMNIGHPAAVGVALGVADIMAELW
jgi:hypothetical protein